MSFKSILPQPATSSGFFAPTVQPTHLSGIVSSVMSFLITFSLVRFKTDVHLPARPSDWRTNQNRFLIQNICYFVLLVTWRASSLFQEDQKRTRLHFPKHIFPNLGIFHLQRDIQIFQFCTIGKNWNFSFISPPTQCVGGHKNPKTLTYLSVVVTSWVVVSKVKIC